MLGGGIGAGLAQGRGWGGLRRIVEVVSPPGLVPDRLVHFDLWVRLWLGLRNSAVWHAICPLL